MFKIIDNGMVATGRWFQSFAHDKSRLVFFLFRRKSFLQTIKTDFIYENLSDSNRQKCFEAKEHSEKCHRLPTPNAVGEKD